MSQGDPNFTLTHHPDSYPAPSHLQATPEPSQDARSLAIAESKGSADAKAAAESAQRRIDIAVEATKRLEEARHKVPFRMHAVTGSNLFM